MVESTFTVEYVADVNELYPRIEVTRNGDSFAFLDFSIKEDRSMVLIFWSKDSCVEIPFEYMKQLMNDAENYKNISIQNVDTAKFDNE